MQNQYGERHLSAVRVQLSEIVADVVTGAVLPTATVSGGVPSDATLVDARVYADGTDSPAAGVILVFEQADFPLVIPGVQIPELTYSLETQAPTRIDTPAKASKSAPAAEAVTPDTPAAE